MLQELYSLALKIGTLTENEAHVKRLFSSVSRIALRGLNLNEQIKKRIFTDIK